jgi:hypothetical protein
MCLYPFVAAPPPDPVPPPEPPPPPTPVPEPAAPPTSTVEPPPASESTNPTVNTAGLTAWQALADLAAVLPPDLRPVEVGPPPTAVAPPAPAVPPPAVVPAVSPPAPVAEVSVPAVSVVPRVPPVVAPVVVAPDPGVLPVGVAVKTRPVFQRGERGLFQVGLAAHDWAPPGVGVRVEVGGLVRSELGRIVLDPGGEFHAPATAFTAHHPGEDVVRVTITVTGPDGRPLGRWAGEVTVRVEDVRPDPPVVHGPVVVMGAASTANPLAGLTAALRPAAPAGAAAWAALDLRPDAGYFRRLERTCPAVGPAPTLAPPWDGQFPALLEVQDSRTGAARRVAVFHGRSAGLGRGGRAAPTWRVRPAPYDYDRHARLSGEHAAVVLRGGRAWLVDHSRNGTWLNGTRVGRDPELLADGDEFALLPDHVAAVRVRLAAGSTGVDTVCLHRADGLDDRLTYLLTAGRHPTPLFWPGEDAPALWLSWRCPPGGPVAVVGGPSGAVEAAAGRLPVTTGRFRVSLAPAAVSDDQHRLLAPFTPGTDPRPTTAQEAHRWR